MNDDDDDDDCGNLRCVGLLCNSQACLATSLVDLDMLLQGPKSPTSKRNHPPLAALYGSLVVHYSFGFTAYKVASGGRGVLFDVGLLGPCKSMPRLAKDLAKHAEIGRGRCQACLGVAKQAYTSQVPIMMIIGLGDSVIVCLI